MNELDSLLLAWTLSDSCDLPGAGVSPSELAAAERELGLSLPSELQALYGLTDGAYLVGGNLRIHPLRGEKFSLLGASAAYRLAHWPVPKEVLIFGYDGSGDPYGVWIGEVDNPVFSLPVVQVGQIFEPGCMAIVGTSLQAFLKGRTVYYLLLEDDPTECLDALEVPARLRNFNATEADYTKIVSCADPLLPSPAYDPYKDRLTVTAVRKLVRNRSGGA